MSILLGSTIVHAQKLELRPYFGSSFYQGDLAPHAHIFSFSEGNIAIGISLGYRVNNLMTLHLKGFKARVSGSDEESKSPGRRQRNLSFFTSITEIGISTDLHLHAILPAIEKYGLDIYFNAGLSIFSFSPRTVYDGRIVALQPLGTEGQGVIGLGKGKRYSLTQFSIPLGIGFSFALTDALSFGVEVIPHLTFTDYLDDVSGSYISYDEQLMYQGMLTADIANRKDEFLGEPFTDYETGSMRGNPDNKDSYIISTIYFSYKFGSDNNSDKAKREGKE